MKGFRDFILRGNVVDLAVGIVIGAAFGAVVTAFVASFLTPLIGLAAGATGDFSKKGFRAGGVLWPYGGFINALISFVLIAAAVYFLVVVPVNRLMERRKTEPEVASTTKECAYCISSIPLRASVCPFCTREQAAIG
jgi:large conductance mechanosensitive channel